MYNLLSKNATELAKETGETEAPTKSPHEHTHCRSYINTSQTPVLTITGLKRILPLITLVSQVKNQRQRKEVTCLISHMHWGRTQDSKTASQAPRPGSSPKGPAVTRRFRHIWASTVVTVVQPMNSHRAIPPQS